VSTIEKAMELLGHFSVARPEIGLSEFCRLAVRDKATTYRHLSALETAGLIEQNPQTRRYRIGPAVLRLAHLREITMPRRAGVRLALPQLADATQETAHASILHGAQLTTLAHHESSAHSTRVVLHDAVLPLHATGSGLAVLGFADEALRRDARRRMAKFTDFTPSDAATLDAVIAETTRTGFGVSHQGYELGVHGVAAPLFDDTDRVAGAVAVASVASRVTPVLERTIRRELIDAARKITASWGGAVPAELDQAWAGADV
jgi:IclR family transcriptional regulator, KDG regulon repressor